MILTRLYELATRENLLDDPAFEELPIPFVIEVGDCGQFLGVSVQRGESFVPSKKKGGEDKIKRDSGRLISVPRSIGSSASQGAARFFADKVPRVVPMTYDIADKPEATRAAEQAKRERSRATFWNQIDRAADETNDDALRSVQAFGRRLASEPELTAKVEHEFEIKGATPNDRCSFAYHLHNGKTLVDHDPARAWFRAFYHQACGAKQEAGSYGFCQVTGRMGPIPTTHPMKLQVPGWMSMGVSLVSYDKAAFESYGLEGTANASIGYEAADGYSVALAALVQNKLPRGIRSASRVGESLYLYWTRKQASLDFMEQFDDPDTQTVESLIASLVEGTAQAAEPDPDDFYCLALSGNAARIIVRDYIEEPLSEARANAATWFRDLKIASTNRDDWGHPVATFPHRLLGAAMTVPKAGNQPDWNRVNELVARLRRAALTGDPLPESILATCLLRLRAEGERGFRPARMALIKLCLKRKGVPVSESLNPLETNEAYICGELLAVFDQIQRAALGKLKANVIDKHYGGFSAAPSTSLGLLFANAQNHLRTLRGEKQRLAAFLDNRLTLATSKLKDVPEGQLSLADQARFALGYYHAKAKRLEDYERRHREDAEKRHSEKARKTAAGTANTNG